ncbi:MAG TPA: hypothetical protein DC048_08485, partial [Planctomycetaceae bacterium]|nr:hypothetical protein [Planctomycetaceae bacterium]
MRSNGSGGAFPTSPATVDRGDRVRAVAPIGREMAFLFAPDPVADVLPMTSTFLARTPVAVDSGRRHGCPIRAVRAGARLLGSTLVAVCLVATAIDDPVSVAVAADAPAHGKDHGHAGHGPEIGH